MMEHFVKIVNDWFTVNFYHREFHLVCFWGPNVFRVVSFEIEA